MPKPTVFVTLVISLLVAGCSGTATPSAAPEGPTPAAAKSGVIRYVDLNNFDVRDMPMQMTLDALAAQGYTIEPTYVENTGLIAEVMGQGDADIAWASNQAMWSAVAEGVEARTIVSPAAATAVLVVTEDVEVCADLDGKRLSGPSATSLNMQLAYLYIEQNCPGVETEYLAIGEPSGRRAALLAGELDASILQSEELLRLNLDEPGRFHALFYIAEEYPDVLPDGIHVRQAWASENPEMVKDFIRTLLESHRRVTADPEVLFAEAVQRLELDEETARALGEAYHEIGVWDVNGGLTPDSVQATFEFMQQYTELPASLTVEGVADLSYLDVVLSEIGRQ